MEFQGVEHAGFSDTTTNRCSANSDKACCAKDMLNAQKARLLFLAHDGLMHSPRDTFYSGFQALTNLPQHFSRGTHHESATAPKLFLRKFLVWTTLQLSFRQLSSFKKLRLQLPRHIFKSRSRQGAKNNNTPQRQTGTHQTNLSPYEQNPVLTVLYRLQ